MFYNQDSVFSMYIIQQLTFIKFYTKLCIGCYAHFHNTCTFVYSIICVSVFISGGPVISLEESEYTVLESEGLVSVCVVLQEGEQLGSVLLQLIPEPGSATPSKTSHSAYVIALSITL